MKKEAIIDIIDNDLKEMQLLLETFKNSENINSAFIELLKSKHQGVAKEIALLDYWAIDDNPSQPQPDDDKPLVNTQTPSKQQAESNDYFADDLDRMFDPFASHTTAPTHEIAWTEEATTSIPSPQTTTTVPTPEPVPEPQPAPQAPKTEAPLAPQPAVTQQQPSAKASKASDIVNYGTPVNDIKKAIAIGDRLHYQKELFGGNSDELNNAIANANTMASYDEAEKYFLQTYGWDLENPTVVNFLRSVHRRFI